MAVGLTPLLAITPRVAVVAGIPAAAEEADTQAVAVVTVAVVAGTTNFHSQLLNKKAAPAKKLAPLFFWNPVLLSDQFFRLR